MIVGSNQPYLFPYIGYWQLMNAVDYYVISDSMNFIRHGYINRNYILIDGERHRFTLEVLGVHSDTLINEIEVGNNSKKILKSIFCAYKKSPYFEEVYPMVEQILLNNEKNLAKYIGYSIEKVADYLGIDTKFIYLSELQGKTPLRGQDRTIDICKRLNADSFINPIGGQEIYDKEDFHKEGIELNFLQVGDVEYKQFNNEFVPNLSILDVMMFNSKEDIKELQTKYILS
ncbi:MAG: WbqC family protein [Sulfurovum sp.]|nr:WbqC family protein [Sulfurovum sp.]